VAKSRNTHRAAFKAQVALEAIRERKKGSEIAKQFAIHPTQINQWKRRAIDGLEEIFEDGRCRKKADESTATLDELYQQIGRLKMELEWVKKKLPSSLDARRSLIEHDESGPSLRRQSEIRTVGRGSQFLLSPTCIGERREPFNHETDRPTVPGTWRPWRLPFTEAAE
jgi:putative transposase